MTYVEEFEKMFVDILLSNNSLLRNCGLHMMISKEHSKERGENSNCAVEKSEPHYLQSRLT